MSRRIRYMPGALAALDEIHDYTLNRWGEAQADDYVRGAFTFCEGLADRPRRDIPERLGLSGYVATYRHHHVYWREAVNGDVIVVCILHGRRDHPRHLAAAFGEAESEE